MTTHAITLTSCITTKILAIYAANHSREIRDVIKSYLFFDKRTIHYAEYLRDNRFDLLCSIIGSRYDCGSDDEDEDDDEGDEGDGADDPGYYAFWTDSHEYNKKHVEGEVDEAPPKFEAIFCVTCGNYFGSNTITNSTNLEKRKFLHTIMCACDDLD
jgi:hypothetical protein